MKKIYYLTLSLIFLGCGQDVKIKTSTNLDVDSLIQRNNQNFENTLGLNRSSDSSITSKVEQTVQKIGQLENEIKTLKEENNELKAKLDDADDAGQPYPIRTISDN